MFFRISLILFSSFFILLGQAFAEDRFTKVDNFFNSILFDTEGQQEVSVCSYSNERSVSFKNQSKLKVYGAITKLNENEETSNVTYYFEATSNGTSSTWWGTYSDGDESTVFGTVTIRYPEDSGEGHPMAVRKPGLIRVEAGNINLTVTAVDSERLVGIADNSDVEIFKDPEHNCREQAEE